MSSSPKTSFTTLLEHRRAVPAQAPALNQLQITQNVVNAAIVGIAVVAIGGGGIAPMRQRWETTLATVEAEAPHAKREVRNSPPAADAVQAEAQQYRS